MTSTPSALLRRLERAKARYGEPWAAAKIELLRGLDRAVLARARDVQGLHEILCFLRAYPDDAPVLEAVERMLASFGRRRDLRRHRPSLSGSGIAGTAIPYRFFWPTARWLAGRWPSSLRLDWDSPEFEDRLRQALPLLVTAGEAEALRRAGLSAQDALERLRGPSETGAAFLVRRIERMAGNTFTREAFHDAIDAAYTLRPCPGSPARTHAKYARAQVVFRREEFPRARPELLREIVRPPRAVRALAPREASRLIDLARDAMVTRARDLDAFAYGSPRDVRLVDDGDGLQFAAIGVVPERRFLLPAIYGYLTLRNGVPIGYVQSDVLYGNAEIAFNTFETFRGSEAAHVFARVLAVARRLFGVRSFSIEPYQLGHGNAEGIESGAWWFYYKLGFRPRDPGVRRVLRRELARMRARPGHRSSAATLKRLAEAHLFLDLEPPRKAVLAPSKLVGFRVARELAMRAGADREMGVRACIREARRLLGLPRFRANSAGARIAWERWSPVVAALPGLSRWRRAEKLALARVIRAKGGRRESDFAVRFDAHPKLGAALLEMARQMRNGVRRSGE